MDCIILFTWSIAEHDYIKEVLGFDFEEKSEERGEYGIV